MLKENGKLKPFAGANVLTLSAGQTVTTAFFTGVTTGDVFAYAGNKVVRKMAERIILPARRVQKSLERKREVIKYTLRDLPFSTYILILL